MWSFCENCTLEFVLGKGWLFVHKIADHKFVCIEEIKFNNKSVELDKLFRLILKTNIKNRGILLVEVQSA